MPDLPRLYLASPLFSETERRRNRELRDALVDAFDVYLPQEDGSLVTELVAEGMPVGEAKRSVFAKDIAAIRSADILLIVLDGRTIDEGACFELGFALALGKVCVGLKTDMRSLLPFGDNPMIECALEARFEEEEALLTWLRRWTGRPASSASA